MDGTLIAARTIEGNVIGYNVPHHAQETTWKWLNSLSCITSVWEESRQTFANRRIKGKQDGY